MSRFVIRLDDICPTMHWENFSVLRRLFAEHGVLPLIGIVPDNRDERLVVDGAREDFWETMRELRQQGWEVAQHGYQHTRISDDPGIFRLNPRAEFAGLPFDRQVESLRQGRAILADEGLATDVFMAPHHSLDETTVRALVDLGYDYVTDGYGLYPYRYQGLVFVPQLFASPIHFGFGVYTICVHPNIMTEPQLAQLAGWVRGNSYRITRFSTAAQMFTHAGKERLWRHVLGFAVPVLRGLKHHYEADRETRNWPIAR